MSKLSSSLKNRLFLTLLSLAAVIAVGCGSSSDEFISTGNNGLATTGTLAYLLQVNGITSVPTGTATLQFDLFDNQNPANGNLVESIASALTDTVTVGSLPATVQSTRVTAFDANGFPIGTVDVNSQVVTGNDGQVDLSQVTFTAVTYDALTATPANIELANAETQQLSLTAAFSNGSTAALQPSTFPTAATFDSGNTNVVEVSNGGLVSVEGAGNTTVTADYTINGVTRSDTVDVDASVFNVSVSFNVNSRTSVTNEFEAFSVNRNSSSQPNYITRLTGPNGVTETVSASELTFAFQPAVSGFSVSSSGEVTVSSSVTGGTTANLVVSHTDSSNRTFTDIIVVTATTNDTE